ncbi:MAG: sigma 54-interacting transcriptional regulator [Acidobacteriota bacterium]
MNLVTDVSLAARYESLIRMAAAVRSHHDGRELFELLARELRLVVPFDAIAQYDDRPSKVHWHICRDMPEPSAQPLADLVREETVAWWVHQQQEIVVIPDLLLETRFPRTMQRLRALGLRSLCALPLSTTHRHLGSLLVASRLVDAYSADEVGFLSLVAGQVALAIDDARNFHESQRVGERLRLLLDLTNRVVSTLDLQALLREIVASLRRVMHCEGVGVTLPDPETGGLRLHALDFPTSRGFVQEGPVTGDVSRSVISVFGTRRPVNMNREAIVADGIIALEGANSLCRVPLVSHERVLGVLSLGSVREHAFSDDDVEFLEQVGRQIAIAVENATAFRQIAELKDKLVQEKVYLEDEIRSELNFEEIVGSSEGLRQVLRQIEIVAPTDSTVLIYGETGTGKELVARAVHNLSPRKANAFVKLNCAAIPTGLLESELFGHEKGAFTGAIGQRIGRFELANHGTVFLDEVGEISLELQPKLLRVLQEREFERLGSTRTMKTDARLIAATNRDLEEMVESQTFRSDLYYRLNVFPVRVPSLRERPDDIPLLVRHFVRQFSRKTQRRIDTIPSESMDALVKYHWPGNVRELQNVIERAVIISQGSVLRVPVADLKAKGVEKGRPRRQAPAPGPSLRETLDETERQRILNALERANWVVAGPHGAAALLKMKRSTLQFRMRKLDIHVSRTGA